jgi:hypothetical protein
MAARAETSARAIGAVTSSAIQRSKIFIILAYFACPRSVVGFGTRLALLPIERGIVVIVMKMEISILAASFLLGTELMARASVQGLEQVIVSTVIEWTVRRMRAAGNILRW